MAGVLGGVVSRRCGRASRMSSTYWFHVQPGVFFDAFMVEHLVPWSEVSAAAAC